MKTFVLMAVSPELDTENDMQSDMFGVKMINTMLATNVFFTPVVFSFHTALK